VYLFHEHNFDEYVVIDLAAELEAGARSYDIAPLFSGIRLHGPAPGATVSREATTLQWRGRADSDYRVCLSNSPDPGDRCEPVQSPVAQGNRLVGGSILLCGLWFLLLPGIRRRHRILVFLAAVLVLAASCQADPTGTATSRTVDFGYPLTGLQPEATYYWQIMATAPDGAFTSRTPVRAFTTGPM
jgi:hypothetical protein